jgi:hypothetical protein
MSMFRPGLVAFLLMHGFCLVWPNSLVMCALFNTLHSMNYSGAGARLGMSRERFFAYTCTGAMLWCAYPRDTRAYALANSRISPTFLDFVPGYLFQALRFVPSSVAVRALTVHIKSLFTWVCWILPNNVVRIPSRDAAYFVYTRTVDCQSAVRVRLLFFCAVLPIDTQ